MAHRASHFVLPRQPEYLGQQPTLEQLAGTVLVCAPVEVLDSWEELTASCMVASSDGSFAGSQEEGMVGVKGSNLVGVIELTVGSWLH